MKYVKKYDYLLVGLVALIYFVVLAAKVRSFVFFSGDAGDWLAASIWWMVPQPYGSPLFITLGHLINAIPVSTLVIRMTILLGVAPSAVTVATMYLICKKYTDWKIAVVCSLVLLGAGVFLTQATILDEFAISGMFVSLAFYFYVNGRKKLTVLMLALGSAIQIIVVAISGIWFLLHLNDIKGWWKTYWIYLVFGLLPYSLVLVLMYLPTPRLLSGSLSLEGINNYLGATGTIGSLSINEAPKRLLEFCSVLIASLAFSLVPIGVSFKGITKYGKPLLVASVTVLFVLWLYLTDNDPGTWHFLPIGFALIMVFVAIGLSKLSQVHQKVVAVGAVVLIVVNGFFLNANVLAKQNPLAQEYENSLRSLADGSYIVSNSGGNYGLDNYYMMASGKDIRPIFVDGQIPDMQMFSVDRQAWYMSYVVNYIVSKVHIKPSMAQQQWKDMVRQQPEAIQSPRYQAYLKWMNEKYGLQGSNTIEQVQWLLKNGQVVYVNIPALTPYWQVMFETVPYDETLERVIGVNVN